MQVNEQAIVDAVKALLAGVARPGTVIVSFEVDRERLEFLQINGSVVIYTPGDFVEVVA